MKWRGVNESEPCFDKIIIIIKHYKENKLQRHSNQHENDNQEMLVYLTFSLNDF